MAQEWILSNTGESFDKWDETDGLGTSTEWRRYQFFCERFVKYPPPLTLAISDLDAEKSASALEVNACGQSVTLANLMTYYDESEKPNVQLESRTLQYNTGESGVLLLSERWVSTSVEDEFLDTSAGGVETWQWRPRSEYSGV